MHPACHFGSLVGSRFESLFPPVPGPIALAVGLVLYLLQSIPGSDGPRKLGFDAPLLRSSGASV